MRLISPIIRAFPSPKAAGAEGYGHGAGGDRLLVLQIGQVLPELLLADLIRRLVVVVGQLLQRGDIRFLSARREPAQLHVPDHPLT